VSRVAHIDPDREGLRVPGRGNRGKSAGSAASEGPSWLEPPRLRAVADDAEERHASWLELFFDLVFVVAIAGLSHELVVDHTTAGFLRFAGLFVPIYVAWQGYMAYADRFDNDDLVFRLAYFGAMLAIAAMAVLIGDVAHGDNSAAFAVAYVVLRSIMLALYLRAWRAVPEARPLIRRYGWGYSAGVAIWLISLILDSPERYVLWGIALALELSLPPLSTKIHRLVPTHGSHLPERWGLFTMIVIGESVVVVALETSGSDWRFGSVAAAVLGFAAVAAVWWLYFDQQASVVLRGTTPSPVIYSYAHLPLLMGLAAMSAGLSLLIERAGEEHLGVGPSAAFLGGVVLFLLSLVATRSVTVAGPHRLGVTLKLGTSAIILGLLWAEAILPPVALATALAAVLARLVVAERTLFPPQTTRT
jgi:low temperature requirement protein LtrA